jgi:hypothetical protein
VKFRYRGANDHQRRFDPTRARHSPRDFARRVDRTVQGVETMSFFQLHSGSPSQDAAAGAWIDWLLGATISVVIMGVIGLPFVVM